MPGSLLGSDRMKGRKSPSRGEGALSSSLGQGEDRAKIIREIDALVDESRDDCLWFVRPGYYPAGDDERLRVLDSIQRHADLARFKKAARLKAWLSAHSSSASAGS